MDERVEQHRERARPARLSSGAYVSGPRQAHLAQLSEMLNAALPAQRLTAMAPSSPSAFPGSGATPPIQRTVDEAIIFAAHSEINLAWPPSEKNIIKMLRSLSATPESHAFIGLKRALLNGQGAEDRERIEALIAGESGESEAGSDQDEMDQSDVVSGDDEEDSDLQRHVQARQVVTTTIETLLPQLGAVISGIEGTDPDDPYLDGLKRAAAFLRAEVGNEEDGGRLVVEPTSERASLAEANMRNQMITFYKAFFDLGLSERENTVLHETIHAVLGVSDVAYHWQRIFSHVPIAKAATNPDHYVARFRQDSPGETPLPQAAQITTRVPGIDVRTVERQVGEAEAIVLWGKTEFVKIAAQFETGGPVTDPVALEFRKSYPEAPPATLKGWASLIATACGTACGFLARKIEIVGTTEAAGDEFVLNGGVLEIKYRTNFADMPLWFCVKIFQQYTPANNSLAKALVATYRGSGQSVL